MDEAWDAVLRAAYVTTDRSPWEPPNNVRHDEAGWRVTLPDHTLVKFDHSASDHFEFMIGYWSDGADQIKLRDYIGREQILHEIIRRAAEAAADKELYGLATPGWSVVFADIVNTMSVSVVAAPIGGVYSHAVDAQGYALPIWIGDKAVIGHLDDSFEEAACALARSVGLPGFRFTGDSWWTKDFMSVHEDPDLEQDESKPWLVAAWALPVSGVAAEHAAVIASEALLGTLVLLDHCPGTYWGRFTPWIPGCPSRAGDPYLPDVIDSDNTIETDPQRVDGRLECLDAAVTSGNFSSPHEIDFEAHAIGPASLLLKAVANAASSGESGNAGRSWKLTSAARLALAASMATASDVRINLVGKAIDLLSDNAKEASSDYMRLSRIGYHWRVEYGPQWPPCRVISTPQAFNEEQWLQNLPSYDQLCTGQDNVENLPAWTIKRMKEANIAMNALQVSFFGLAALLSSEFDI